jgi:amidase
VGVRHEGFLGSEPTHPEVRAALGRAEAVLRDLGHELSEGGPSALDDPRIPDVQGIVTSTGVAGALEGFAQRIGRVIELDELEPITAAVIEAGRSHSALDYRNAREELIAYTRRVVPWWESHDLLLTPTITCPPPRIGEIHAQLSPAEVGRLRAQYGWLTPPWNVTGQPAISLPVHWTAEGLPIGIQLVAAPGREDVLVRVAAQLEPRIGWLERSPG